MTGHCYEWPRPGLTSDIAVFATGDGPLSILLIRRKNAPFAGGWALPGGFLDAGETLEACAARELREETALEAADLRLVGVYSDPARDPRGWTVSAGYLTRVDRHAVTPQAGDDAAEVRWFACDALPVLAFDHARIIAEAIATL